MKLLKFTLVLAWVALLFAQSDSALQRAIRKETLEGDLKGAIDQYKKLAQGKDRAVAAKALVRMGQCYDRLGDAEARKAYERVVREFADQKEAVAEARRFLAAKGQPDGSAAGVVARQIAKIGDNRQFAGGVSRDGRYTAFTLGGVFLFDLKTGEERRLVQRIGEEKLWNAVISPDGRQIAYARASANAGPVVQLVGVDGSGPRSLEAGGEGSAIPFAWTPDGRRLLVVRLRVRENQTPERVLASVSGDAQTVIGTGYINGAASFSPDGSVVAFGEYQDESKPSSIVLLPLRGGKPETIAEGWNTAWTPDGTRLLFTQDRDGSSDLWSIRIESGKAVWAPDFVKQGVDMLLSIGPEGDCFYRTATFVRNLFTARIDPQTGKLAGQPEQIAIRDKSSGAAWSPNGEFLAYYKWQNGSSGYKVMIRSMKTREDREVPLKESFNAYSVKPQWFPDNRSLFVHFWDSKLRRLDIETGELRPLLESAKIPLYTRLGNVSHGPWFVLSPDGRTVYYAARGPEAKGSRILTRDLAGGAEREIARIDSRDVSELAISADGSRLAVYHWPQGRATILTLPASGGEIKQVYSASLGQDRFPHDVMWSRDGRRLFFLMGYGKSQVLSIPAEGGEPQSLGIDLHNLNFLNLHPDGKQIIFADEQWNNQLWVLKNLFGEKKATR